MPRYPLSWAQETDERFERSLSRVQKYVAAHLGFHSAFRVRLLANGDSRWESVKRVLKIVDRRVRSPGFRIRKDPFYYTCVKVSLEEAALYRPQDAGFLLTALREWVDNDPAQKRRASGPTDQRGGAWGGAEPLPSGG